MKLLKPLIVIVLLASLAGNFALYWRQAGKRVVVAVNDTKISKRNQDMYLQIRHGTESLARLTRYELVEQACKKEGLPIDMKEIDEAIQELKEISPDKALEFKQLPYTEEDQRNEFKYSSGMINLMTKDVKVTDEEIKEFFEQNPGAYDKPTKLYFKAFKCAKPEKAQQAKNFLEKTSEMMSIQQQLDPKGSEARMVGVDGTMMLAKPFDKPSKEALINEFEKAPIGTVRIVPTQNNVLLVMKLEKIVPGKKVALDEVKDKVIKKYKMTRALPQAEVLRKLWDESKIETEDPSVRKQLQWFLFHDPKDLQ